MRQKKPPFLGRGERGANSFEPLWPWGAAAHLVPVFDNKGQPSIDIRKVELQSASRTRNGWRLEVGRDFWRTQTFYVGEDGTSADCVPWDDEIEAQVFPVVEETVNGQPVALTDDLTWEIQLAEERDHQLRESFKLRSREVERNGKGS